MRDKKTRADKIFLFEFRKYLFDQISFKNFIMHEQCLFRDLLNV